MEDKQPKLPVVGNISTIHSLIHQYNNIQREIAKLVGLTTYDEKQLDGTFIEVDVNHIKYKNLK